MTKTISAHNLRVMILARLSRYSIALMLAIFLVWSGLPDAVNAADGMLDPTFDTDGRQTTSFGATSDFANAVAIQPDGKIVVAGRTGFPAAEFSTNSDFAILRYNPDGSLDTTFGGTGTVITNINDDDEFYGVAIQPDGKIVAVGRTGARRGLIGIPQVPTQFAVLRYNADGTLDSSFDADGIVTTTFADSTTNIAEAFSVAIQPDGMIVVAGYTLTATGRDFAIARYDTNGSPDNLFDTDGQVTTDFTGSSSDQAQDVALHHDGKIIVAGVVLASANGDFGVARYNSNGSPDMSFDSDGKVTTDFNGGPDTGRGVAIQADGKIVVAGSAAIPLPPAPFSPPSFTRDFGLVRYNDNGGLDMSFDSDGKVTTDFANRLDDGNDVAIQFDGKIVVVGIAELGVFNQQFGLARYNPNDGSLDTSFDGDGRVTTDFNTASNSFNEGTDVAIQLDGKIVAVGTGVPPNSFVFGFAAARYDSGPTECVNAPPNMISWWPGDGDANDIIDGNTGTLMGGAGFAAGRVDQAFSFDGLDDHVFIGDPANLRITGDITIDAWVNTEDLSEGQVAAIVTKWDQSVANDSYGLWLKKINGAIQLLGGIGDGSTADTGLVGGGLAASSFAHVAMTYEAATGINKLYVNGLVVASRVRAGGINPSNKNVLIGLEDSVLPRPFPGLIDEVEIFDRALTKAEIQSLVFAGTFGKCKADLSIVKTTSSASAFIGSNITFTLTVFNAGPAAAQNVVVTDVLPANVSFVSCSTSGGVNGQCSESMGIVTATFDSLAAGDTATVTIEVTVNAEAAPGGSIVNTASVASDTGDPNQGNNVSDPVEVIVFDICLEDDSSANSLLFNSFTGDYVFCCPNLTLAGTGRVSKRGKVVTLTQGANETDRRLTAGVDGGAKRGSASLQFSTVRCIIQDRNTTDNSCTCSLPAPVSGLGK